MGLTSLPKRGEGQVLGPIKAESSLNLWDRLRRVFTSEWNGNAKGLEEVCEEVGLHDGSTEGSLVARVNALEGGGGVGGAVGGVWEDATLTGGTGNTVAPAIVQGVGSDHAMTWSRTGGAAVAAGDQVTVVSKVETAILDGAQPDVRWGALPVPANLNSGVVAQLSVRVTGGSYTGSADFDVQLYDSATKLRAFSGSAVSGATTLELTMHATYVAQGPG